MSTLSNSLIEYLLFEQPWPLMIVLLAVAVVLRMVAVRTQQPRLQWGALAAVLLGAGVYGLAWAVETDLQRIEDQTRELVTATEQPVDLATVDRLIHPNAGLSGPNGDHWLGYDQIFVRLESVVDRFTIEGQTIRNLAVEMQTNTQARAVVDLRTESSFQGGLPLPTQWALTWQKDDDNQWRVIDIQWLELRGQPPSRSLGVF